MSMPRREIYVSIDKRKLGSKDASIFTTILKEYVSRQKGTLPYKNGRSYDFINILINHSVPPPAPEPAPEPAPLSIIYEGGNASGHVESIILNGESGGVVYDGLNS